MSSGTSNNISLILFCCFRTHINDLYAGHQSGTIQNESTTQARLGRKRSQSIMISVKKNAAVMNVKAQMVRNAYTNVLFLVKP